MAEEKFGGLSPQQLKQLEELKKSLPEKSEGKSEVSAGKEPEKERAFIAGRRRVFEIN